MCYTKPFQGGLGGGGGCGEGVQLGGGREEAAAAGARQMYIRKHAEHKSTPPINKTWSTFLKEGLKK